MDLIFFESLNLKQISLVLRHVQILLVTLLVNKLDDFYIVHVLS